MRNGPILYNCAFVFSHHLMTFYLGKEGDVLFTRQFISPVALSMKVSLNSQPVSFFLWPIQTFIAEI